MAKKLLLGCGLPLLVLGLIAFFAGRALLKPKPKVERSETVQRGDVDIKVVETGAIEPLRKVEVKSKAGGRVQRLLVDEGDVVRTGQTLALIDPQEINSQVEAVRAQLAGAQARLAAARKGTLFQKEQTDTGISQFVQNAEAAKARVQMIEAEARVQPELTEKAIAIAQANLDAAKAQRKAQQDSLDLLLQSTHPQAVVNARSAYEQAKAQSENAARNLKRQQQLVEKGFVAQQAVDTARTDVLVADANLRQTKERLDRIAQTNNLEAANARSQVLSAQSQVRQMEAALAQAKTSVLPLTKQQELANARAAYRQAQAQLEAARSNKLQDRMREDQAHSSAAEVRQIQNQLKELLVRQADTTLLASMSGVVTKRYVEEGEIITSAISSFSAGTPVFQISDLATMLVKINVNEVDIAKAKQGLLTEVTIDAARGVTFKGHVRKVAPAALTAANAANSGGGGGGGGGNQTVIRFPVEIQIDKADPRLKPGMSARCTVIVARRKNVLRVPSNCVTEKDGKATVQIVTTAMKDGKPVETAAPREVKLGLKGDNFIEILSGLKEGEKVRPAPYTGPPRKKVDVQGGPGGM